METRLGDAVLDASVVKDEFGHGTGDAPLLLTTSMLPQSSDHRPSSPDRSYITHYLHNLWQSLVMSVTSWKPPQPLSHYTDGWEVLYNSSPIQDNNNQWSMFWHEWWGANSPGKAHLEFAAREDPKTTSPRRILKVTQAAIWRKLNTLGDSQGSLLMREEYTSLYDRLSAPLEGMCSGIKVSGHPGIGE